LTSHLARIEDFGIISEHRKKLLSQIVLNLALVDAEFDADFEYAVENNKTISGTWSDSEKSKNTQGFADYDQQKFVLN